MNAATATTATATATATAPAAAAAAATATSTTILAQLRRTNKPDFQECIEHSCVTRLSILFLSRASSCHGLKLHFFCTKNKHVRPDLSPSQPWTLLIHAGGLILCRLQGLICLTVHADIQTYSRFA